MSKKKEKAEENINTSEAADIIRQLGDLGMDTRRLAQELGVSEVYASRLNRASYWKNGTIPTKTGLALRSLLKRLSPKYRAQDIFDHMSQLQAGDVYCIHSGREIMEFRANLIRQGILRSANKGVKVVYMFPDATKIFPNFSMPPLELIKFISPDLGSRYRLLMQTFLLEAKELGICSIERVKENIEICEVVSPFLFSPWSKLVVYQFKRARGVTSKVVQENFPMGEAGEPSTSSYDWVCDNQEAEAIAKLILASNRRRLEWE
jgi:hypothetical protein